MSLHNSGRFDPNKPSKTVKMDWSNSGKGEDATAVANVDGPGGNWKASVYLSWTKDYQQEGNWSIHGPYSDDDRNYPEGVVRGEGKDFKELFTEAKKAAKDALLAAWASMRERPPEGVSDEDRARASGPSEYTLNIQREHEKNLAEAAEHNRLYKDCEACRGEGVIVPKFFVKGDKEEECSACQGKGWVPR